MLLRHRRRRKKQCGGGGGGGGVVLNESMREIPLGFDYMMKRDSSQSVFGVLKVNPISVQKQRIYTLYYFTLLFSFFFFFSIIYYSYSDFHFDI